MNRTNEYPWRVFVLLLIAGTVGVAAIVPYSLALSAKVLEKIPLPLPLAIVLTVQFAQNVVLLGVALGIGLLVSQKIGLGAPIVECWIYKRQNIASPTTLARSAIVGVAVGTLLVIIANLIFRPVLPELPGTEIAALPLWKRFLACVYGAIDEEILMRLFLLAVVLWLMGKFWHTSQDQPTNGAFWTTNVLVSIVFGLAHMPAAALVAPMNTTILLYILSLNGIGSFVFGYLFWRSGLESAMIAHFFTDIVLLVIAPAFWG